MDRLFPTAVRGALVALVVLVTGALLAPGTVAQAAEADWIQQSNGYTQWLLEVNGRYGPEEFANNGLEQYDKDVTDLKPGFLQREAEDLEAVAAKLNAAASTVTDERVKQDLSILIKSARQTRDTLLLNQRLMVPYFDLPRMVFGSFTNQLDSRVSKKRQAAAIVRLRRYVGTERGYEPITTLARARVEERMNDSSLTWPWEKEVQQQLGNVPTYLNGIRDLFRKSGLKGWEKDFATLSRQLTEHNEWVRKTVLPRARKTNQLPPEMYADNLKNFGVDADPRQLMQRALFAFMQTRDEMDAVAKVVAAQRGFASSDYRDVIRELKKQQMPADKVLELYKSRLGQVEDIIRREHIVTLPTRPAVIRLATEAEAAASPAPYLSPPRLIGNTGESAEFVLVTRNPNAPAGSVVDDFTYDAIAWALVSHEARPGHELQFASLVERGVSTARVIYAFNSANVEGWGLYAEAIMKQYLPPEGQLAALQIRLMRTARAYLDPMLNLGLIEPDAAQRVLTEQVVLSEPFAKSEVDR